MKKKLEIYTSDKISDFYNKDLIFLKEQYEKKNNVLYFPANRKLLIKTEQINTDDERVMNKLAYGKNFTLKELIEYSYDMKDPFAFENCGYGEKIHCGYLQIMNILYQIKLSNYSDLIVIIEHIENNLHPLIQYKFIFDLFHHEKVKTLICSSFSEYILNEWKQYVKTF